MTQGRKKRSTELPSIPAQVNTWRVHRGFRQGELEERAGLAHNAVSRIETGKVSPRLETLERLAAALEIGVEQLQFSAPPEKKPDPTDNVDEGVAELIDRLQSIEPAKRSRLLRSFLDLLDIADGES